MGCGEGERSLQVRDAKSGRPLEIAVCYRCGLVRLDGIAGSNSLREYYSHRYREDYKGSRTPKPKHIYRAAIAAYSRLKFIESGLKSAAHERRPTTLLDIGAGGGEVVCIAEKLGFAASGIEPNLGYSEFARLAFGVQVDTLHFDEALDRRADLVTLFHVLEHMPNPSSVLSALWAVVNPGGYLMVEVPNIEQADASPANIFFQAHLFYFSKSSLLALASPYFEPIAISERGNLMVLFKRREVISPMRMPTASSVAQTLRRLDQKGWFEYLTKGGGLLKPFRRIAQYWREHKVRRMSPIEIISFAIALSDKSQ